MTIRPKLRRLPKQAATKPWTMTLALVRDDLDLQTPALGTAAAQLALADALVYQLLDVALQAATKVFVQRAAAGQDDVLVQAAAHVDGRRLDDLVDDNE